MSEVDIRNPKRQPITSIRFSDNSIKSTTVASVLSVAEVHQESRLEIRDNCFDNYNDGAGYVVIANEEHARNLIKALEFAIELGLLK